MLFDSEWRALKWSIVQCVYSYTIILLTCFTLNEWLEKKGDHKHAPSEQKPAS